MCGGQPEGAGRHSQRCYGASGLSGGGLSGVMDLLEHVDKESQTYNHQELISLP